MTFFPPFGIDLGTTQSAAAILTPGDDEPRLATTDPGHHTMPSVLRQTADGRWRAGRDALNASEDTPLIGSIKRRIGRHMPLPETDDIDATEGSAIILAAIAAAMQSHLDDRPWPLDGRATRAVITVPAYFDAPQIEATRRAGHLAGLDVVGLLQEPTAAAIYHCWHQRLGDGTYLIYDLGGGTFDVTILRSLFGEYQVLSIAGDNHLGGDDFDRRLAALIRQRLIDDGANLRPNLDHPVDADAFRLLQPLAREAKEALTDRPSIRLQHDDLITDHDGRPIHLHLELCQSDLADAIDDLLDSTLQSCEHALHLAAQRHDLSPSDVNAIFLVGGSTRMPAVQNTLANRLAPRLDLDAGDIIDAHPQTAVARGAALHAAAVAPLQFRHPRATVAITDLPGDGDDLLIGRLQDLDDADPHTLRLTYADAPTTDAGDDTIAQHPLDRSSSPPRFAVDDLPDEVGRTPQTSHLLAYLTSPDQDDLGPIDLWLPRRSDDAPPPPALTLSNPAVVSKNISIEVQDSDRPRRQIIIPQGTHLPTRSRTRLRVGDESEAVVLRLFQHHLPIKTIVLDRPTSSTPGDPIELVVDIDQAMHLKAFGQLGDREFSLTIERPKAPKTLDWDTIEGLIDLSADLDEHLWGAEAQRFRRRRQTLIAGLQAALTQDPDRLQVLARRLQRLVDEYRPRPGRTPGRHRLTALLDRIRRLVFARSQPPLNRSLDQWRQHLDDLRQQLDRAWSADDASWRDVADRIQATFESVAHDEALFRRRDPQRHAQMLSDSARLRLQHLQRRLRAFPLSDHPRERHMQRRRLQDLMDELDALQHKLPGLSSPSSLQTIHHRLDRLDDRLTNLHSLGLPNPGDSP